MAQTAAKQFSFRLPQALVHRVEDCMTTLRKAGLDLNRADVVRLLLKHALDSTNCDVDRLFGASTPRKRAKKRPR